MHLKDLKAKNPSDLLTYAESLDIENASSLRKQDMMFACLKKLADNETESDREQENVPQPENHQDIVSQSLPPEMEAIMNEGMV